MFTLDELKEQILREYDADLLLERLQITAEELLDRFEDRLMMVADVLEDELDEH